MGERVDAAAIAEVLGEMIDLLTEYEVVRWVKPLTADRARIMAGDDRAVQVIRFRLDAPGGLREIRIGFADRALNARLDVLRDRLDALTEPPPPPVEESVGLPDEPPRYGERVEAEPLLEGVRFARDHPRGTVLYDHDGHWWRSTVSLLDYDEHNRLRVVMRVWKPTIPVSIEEYRSLRRSCIGWWVTLAAIPLVAAAAGVAGATGEALMWVFLVCGVSMPAVAMVVGWFERRRSAVTAIFSERTRTFIAAVSRGARPPRGTRSRHDRSRDSR